MKTLIASVLFTAFTAVSSIAFAQNVHPAAQLEVARLLVENANTGKIDVLVFKSQPKSATVAVVDQDGNTLAIRSIAKKTESTRTRFDLNNLPDGTYHIVLIEGKQKIVKDIILNTENKEIVRTVSVG